MKAMKKLLSLVLVLAMVLSFAVPAMAEEPDFTLTLDKASYKVGETAYVTVKLNKSYTMCNLNLRVWYDPAVFTYDKANSQIGDALKSCGLKNLTDPVPGNYNKLENYTVKGWKPVNITAAYLGYDDVFDGTLAVIAFTVIAESENDAPFTITLTELSNIAGEALTNQATVGQTSYVKVPEAQEEPEKPTTPFLSITTADGEAVSYTFKGMVPAVSSNGMEYDDGPYYHVTVPAGTESVLVTYPEDVNILGSPAYSYTLSVPEYELGYGEETFQVKTNSDGSKTVTIPVANYLLTNGAGTAMSLEAEGTFEPITFLSFAYAEDSGETPDPSGPETKGYTITASEDKDIAVGEDATVSFQVGGDQATFNAYDLTITYDAEKLTYKSGTAADEGATIDGKTAGTVRVVGYGADKNIDTNVVTLTFTGKNIGSANVVVSSAKVDISAKAIDSNAPDAAILDDPTVITISGYTVKLGDGLSGDSVVTGKDYTFTATDWDNYDYEISATMGGQTAEVTDNGDGTYTIKNVTGNLDISATMTPKSYNVTINGEDTTGAGKATYNTDYTFTVDQKDGFSYVVAVTVGGTSYDKYTVSGGSYTIPGTDITGDIVINVTKTAIPVTQFKVSFDGTGAADANGAETATQGKDYTFTLDKAEGFKYEVTATMGSQTAEVIDNENGTYTIKKVTGDLVITVTKTSDLTVEVTKYITLDEQAMYLVTVSGTIAEGNIAKYDGMAMYWSEEYNAYAWLLVSADDLDAVKTAATGKVTIAEGTAAGTVDYSGDVNGTGTVDVNDVQLTYDMYNTKYTSIGEVSMLKFLNADTNFDKIVNVNDAAKIVGIIMGGQSE